MSARRIALLDLDGTLSDPREGILDGLRHAFATVGAPAPPRRALGAWIGPPLAQSFERAFPAHPELATRALTAYRERYGARGWRQNVPIAGIDDQLAALRAARVECWVTTSKLERFARRIVAHFRFDRWVAHVYGSLADGGRAEKDALIAHALADQGVGARDRLVMVGDRHHDVRGARRCGLPAVGVLWGFGSREELAGAGATAIVDEPAGLAATVTALVSPHLTPGSVVG